MTIITVFTGQTDTFKVECKDVGEVHKLRVGHNGKGAQSGWHLEKIVLYKATQKLTPRNVSLRFTFCSAIPSFRCLKNEEVY